MRTDHRFPPVGRWVVVVVMLSILGHGRIAFAQDDGTISPDQFTTLFFEQKLNAQVSLGLTFQDENGQVAELRHYFAGKPVILVLGYYQCPMLCNLSLNGLVESLQQIRSPLVSDARVVFVSIDPTETPLLAEAKKRTYVKRYGRSDAAASWHFLTGREPSLRRLADEIGFHYAYDPDSRQYAHPSGMVILTPEGRVSQYFLGISYSARELKSALDRAGSNQPGTRVQQLLMLCSQFMPLTGKYSGAIMWAVRLLAVGTVLALAAFVITTRSRHKKHPSVSVEE